MWGDFQSESFRLNVRRTMVESDQNIGTDQKSTPSQRLTDNVNKSRGQMTNRELGWKRE